MKTTLSIFAIAVSAAGYCDTPYPGSYYITTANDTVPVAILYSDIISLQEVLHVQAADGTVKSLSPGDIKGFCISVKQSQEPFRLGEQQKIESLKSHDDKSIRVAIVKHGAFNVWADVYGLSGKRLANDNLYFETETINSKRLFLNARCGSGGPLKYFQYYFPIYSSNRKSWVISEVSFLQKDGRFVDRGHNHFAKWLSRATSDYSLLSEMVKKKELNANTPKMKNQSPNLSMIVNEYNNWKLSGNENPMDTSVTLHGIADADKNFHPKKAYWVTALASCAFMFPGMIVGQVCFNKEPKDSELNIPANSRYRNDPKYLEGYKMRAMYKKSRAIIRGIWTGGAVCYAAIFL
jgi:hypothetical protein